MLKSEFKIKSKANYMALSHAPFWLNCAMPFLTAPMPFFSKYVFKKIKEKYNESAPKLSYSNKKFPFEHTCMCALSRF